MSAKSRSLRIACVYTIGTAKTVRYGVAGCRLFRGCLSIEVNGRAIGTFRIVRYIVDVRYSAVSVKRGSTVLHRAQMGQDVHVYIYGIRTYHIYIYKYINT